MSMNDLPPGFKKTWLIKTSDNKLYEIYSDEKGEKYIYYHGGWKSILGSASLRMNLKEKSKLNYDLDTETWYKFSKDLKEDYFIIFEDSNKDNKIASIKEVKLEIEKLRRPIRETKKAA